MEDRPTQKSPNPDSSEPDWQRTVMIGLAAVAASAVIIGVVVGVMAVGAASLVGIGESSAGPGRPESLYLPAYSKTPLAEETEEEPSSPRSRVSAVPLDPTDGPTSEVGEITLYANPVVVAAGERINLNGVYLDGEGVSLQVQRQEGAAWLDFPTTASVKSGGFDTYVYTGRFGDNVFRVFDPTTGRSSNAVTVTVE
ncbi:MAG TPA: hypothetical protein VLI04_13080 [Nocardioidaceae bacterium]|nr:hypothetical protein [Nocardioidaceae bacterium]